MLPFLFAACRHLAPIVQQQQQQQEQQHQEQSRIHKPVSVPVRRGSVEVSAAVVKAMFSRMALLLSSKPFHKNKKQNMSHNCTILESSKQLLDCRALENLEENHVYNQSIFDLRIFQLA
jgi:hypothetical protein